MTNVETLSLACAEGAPISAARMLLHLNSKICLFYKKILQLRNVTNKRVMWIYLYIIHSLKKCAYKNHLYDISSEMSEFVQSIFLYSYISLKFLNYYF